MVTSLNWTAIIAAIASVGSLVSVAIGHPALAAIFSDPSTQTEATAAVGALGALVSTFSSAVHVGVIHTPAVQVASVPVSTASTK